MKLNREMSPRRINLIKIIKRVNDHCNFEKYLICLTDRLSFYRLKTIQEQIDRKTWRNILVRASYDFSSGVAKSVDRGRGVCPRKCFVPSPYSRLFRS